jgi:hypothetical protein
LLEVANQTELEAEFLGKYNSISVCDITECRIGLLLAAFYGNSSRLPPLTPSVLTFTDVEIEAAGGRLEKTDPYPAWPPEYVSAHHDIIEGQSLVASGIVMDAVRRIVSFSRVVVVAEMVSLALRADTPAAFVKNVRKKLRKIYSEEPLEYEKIVLENIMTKELIADS